MSTITTASHQWATRPADERFCSLTEMLDSLQLQQRNSQATCVASRKIKALPAEDGKGLLIAGPDGHAASPSHWAFGQLAGLAEAPAGYLRSIHPALAADCINWGLAYKREVEDVGALLRRDVAASGNPISAAAFTGPRYGRIWNADIVQGLVNSFGDGLGGSATGDSPWRVPGEFGIQTPITKENTTLFAGDRDMFVFLADEINRVEVPDRRAGAPGMMARGFFVSNSEVGSGTLSLETFLFDYVCCNRIVWGARSHKRIAIRHTPKAPVRWLEEITPALEAYHQESTLDIVGVISRAKAARLDDPSEFLAKRFGKNLPALLQDIHMDEEQRPIETIWDAVTAVTAHARGLSHQDRRVTLERQAGDLLDLASR